MSIRKARKNGLEIELINEFRTIEKFAKELGPAVSIFGSARTGPATPSYQLAYDIAALLAVARYSILSGGGPGIMRAANAGAQSVGGHSVGINIALPFESLDISQQDTSLLFSEFFTRKKALLHYSEAFVFLPGGVGTLDETFELLMLMQTGKLEQRPVVLIDSSFWAGLLEWMRAQVLDRGLISEDDFANLAVFDSPEDAVNHVTSRSHRNRTEFV